MQKITMKVYIYFRGQKKSLGHAQIGLQRDQPWRPTWAMPRLPPPSPPLGREHQKQQTFILIIIEEVLKFCIEDVQVFFNQNLFTLSGKLQIKIVTNMSNQCYMIHCTMFSLTSTGSPLSVKFIIKCTLRTTKLIM